MSALQPQTDRQTSRQRAFPDPQTLLHSSLCKHTRAHTHAHTHISYTHIYTKLVCINTYSLDSESALSFHSGITRLSNSDCRRSSDSVPAGGVAVSKPCQMRCVCVCVCVCVRVYVRAVTHGTAQEPRRCCPDSRCLRHTSSAPGCSGCSCKQTPRPGTEEGVRKTGWLWKEK